MIEIYLAGNANVGKTTLYNRLTGSFEHAGNWHGVTVAAKRKTVRVEGREAAVSDLPGLYSLNTLSPEEDAARDAVLNLRGGVVAYVCEANNLARNLYLFLQLKERGLPLLLAVNMTDELKRGKKSVDYRVLSSELNVPVVPVSAKYGTDVKKLLAEAVALYDRAARGGAAERKSGGGGASAAETDADVAARYARIEAVIKKAVRGGGENPHGYSRIDGVLLNKRFALPIFAFIMAAVFYLTFGLIGKYMTDGVRAVIDLAGDGASRALIRLGAPAWVKELVSEGIINGAGTVFTFLPQITLLFLFLALLEDTGYLSRAAFMFDGIFRRVGLSGRSVFTMLMGFGCSTGAVATARNLENEPLRKKTVLLTPFMPCSARLPVFSVLAAAFLLNQWLLIFLLYALGVVVALLLGFLFEKIPALKSEEPYFIMEMPPYRLPSARRVSRLIWENMKIFLTRVATVIFGLSVIVWILSNFSFSLGFVPEAGGRSVMQILSGAAAFLFLPLGFGNWRAVTALLAGFIAKESVISTLQELAGAGGVSAVFGNDPNAAVAFAAFVLLYVPCLSASGAIMRELGRRWMWFSLGVHFAAAYAGAFVLYWTGTLLSSGALSAGLLICAVLSCVLVIRVTRGRGARVRAGKNCGGRRARRRS